MQNTHQLSFEDLDRFYATARLIRDSRVGDCPILSSIQDHALAFDVDPRVRQMWEDTGDLLKVSAAVEEVTKHQCRQSVLDQIRDAKDIRGIPKSISWKNRTWSSQKITYMARSLDELGQLIGGPYVPIRKLRAQVMWDDLSPVGPCHDRIYTGQIDPKSRYGFSWILGDHVGRTIYSPGNLAHVREMLYDVANLAHTADFRQHHSDGYTWCGPAMILHARTFGTHSMKLLLNLNIADAPQPE